MNKFIRLSLNAFLILAAAATSGTAFADSNPYGDFTTIDCQNGSDADAAPFDSSKPAYFSLKKGIEDSLAFLANGRFTDGSKPEYQGKTFEIHVKGVCHYTHQDGGVVYLGFDSVTGKNRLTIMGEDQGRSFGVVNQFFYLTTPNSGNITFKNANFLRNDVTGYYFDGYNPSGAGCGSTGYSYNGNGVKIVNSIININAGRQFSHYTMGTEFAGCWYGGQWSNYFQPGGYLIDNASVTYYVNANADFRLPVIVKDSKIKVKNANLDGAKYDVAFNVAGRDGEGYKYGSATVISSEIDMGGNNFKTDDNMTNFVNDKFVNVGSFTAGTDPNAYRKNVFVNNSVQCTNEVNISRNDIAYNNLFSAGFVDTNDTDNFKRNFSGISTNEKGVGWIYHKSTGGFINVSVDYKTLYEQLHENQTLDEGANPVYLVIE